MAMSGIKVDDACMEIFKKMKLTKKDDKNLKRKVASFIINKEQTKVILEENFMQETEDFSREPEKDAEMFQRLIDFLKKDSEAPSGPTPRYILYDIIFNGDKGRVEKLSFISWCPDTASIKKKMIFAATKDTLVKKFEGVPIVIQAVDFSDIMYEDMKKQAEKVK